MNADATSDEISLVPEDAPVTPPSRIRATAQPTSTPPGIHRCQYCGGLVHHADPKAPLAWCPRCRLFVPVPGDGEPGMASRRTGQTGKGHDRLPYSTPMRPAPLEAAPARSCRSPAKDRSGSSTRRPVSGGYCHGVGADRTGVVRRVDERADTLPIPRPRPGGMPPPRATPVGQAVWRWHSDSGKYGRVGPTTDQREVPVEGQGIIRRSTGIAGSGVRSGSLVPSGRDRARAGLGRNSRRDRDHRSGPAPGLAESRPAAGRAAAPRPGGDPGAPTAEPVALRVGLRRLRRRWADAQRCGWRQPGSLEALAFGLAGIGEPSPTSTAFS